MRNIARKIESKLAARVPGPLEGIISDRNQRRSVPKTPPNETSSTGFSFFLLLNWLKNRSNDADDERCKEGRPESVYLKLLAPARSQRQHRSVYNKQE